MPPPERPAQAGPRGPSIADRAHLFAVLSGTWLAQACYALAKLGIADEMAAGPRSVADLAVATGTDRRALLRLLRALGSAGLVSQVDQDRFELTPAGQPLRSGVPRSSHDAAVMFGEEVFRSFEEIGYTLQTGRPAFDKVFGQSFYDYLADHPDAARTFTAAMGDGPVPAALATCDLTGLRVIVDVGGGNGGLLARVLGAHRTARGVLVDLPSAIKAARERLGACGVADRVEFAEGSFFDPLPAGADVYVLSRVLHNWDDEDAARLLGRVREAIAPDGRLIVFEQLIEQADHARPSEPSGQVIDLLILLMLAGRDRTADEYTALLDRSGFDVAAVRPGPLRARQAEHVIEAVPRT
jgi:hypothetical protein